MKITSEVFSFRPVLPNAERLSYAVTLDASAVIEPSSIVMDLDSYDLSAGVVLPNDH